jgi:hypothetical protein
MFDTSRVKPKETIVISQPTKYPNTPVLTLIPGNDEKRHTIKLNQKAVQVMGINPDKNRIILVPDYDIAGDNQPTNYQTILAVTAEKTVRINDRNTKTYDCHLATRSIKSKEIHNAICTLFNLNEEQEHEVEIVTTSLPDVYVFHLLNTNVTPTVESVDVEFNKGEEVQVEESIA